MDSTVLARFGARSTLMAFESVTFEIKSRENGRADRNDEDMAAWELRQILNDDGYLVSVLLLRSCFVE